MNGNWLDEIREHQAAVREEIARHRLAAASRKPKAARLGWIGLKKAVGRVLVRAGRWIEDAGIGLELQRKT
jgi:hypothetical protein